MQAVKAKAAKRRAARGTRAKKATAARGTPRRTTRARKPAATALTLPPPPVVTLPDLAAFDFGGTSATPMSAAPLVATTATLAPAAATPAASRPFAGFSRSAGTLLDAVVARARSQLGTRYVLGGERPGEGLDCSSFARYTMEALGVRLPRTAAQQARVGREVPRDRARLRPGDLLTFGSKRRVSHVGIYLGDGRFAHASVTSGRVIETTIDRNRSLFRRWQGARRLIADADTTAARDANGS